MRCATFCFLAITFSADFCEAQADRIELLLSSIHTNRRARLAFEYEFTRESPLLAEPIEQTYRVETQFGGEFNRITELRPHPDNENWLLRSDAITQGGDRLNVSTTVSAKDPTDPQAGEFAGLLLSHGSIWTPFPQLPIFPVPEALAEDPYYQQLKMRMGSTPLARHHLLIKAEYNLALGVVLGAPFEWYLGKLGDQGSTRWHGSACTVRTPFGTSRLAWVEPDDVYPTQIVVTVGADDYIGKQRLSEVNMRGGKGWPEGGLRSVTSEVREIRVEQHAEQAVPVSWNCVDTYVCADESTVIERCRVRVVSVELEARPEDAGVLPVFVPAGTPVTVPGSTDADYQWDGEWAVPIVNTRSQNQSRRNMLLLVSMVLSSITVLKLLLKRWS